MAAKSALVQVGGLAVTARPESSAERAAAWSSGPVEPLLLWAREVLGFWCPPQICTQALHTWACCLFLLLRKGEKGRREGEEKGEAGEEED